MNKEQRTTLLHILVAAAMLVILHFLPWHTILRFSAPVNRAIQILLYLIPYLTVGHEVLLESLHNIKEGEFFDEAFLMMLVTVGAFIIGEYPEATAVMLFYEVGELFSDVAEDRSRRSISSLLDIIPQKAIVLREGQEEELPPEEIQPGELLLVRPGERIPLDGEVVEGISSLNTAALTGESLPVNISVGDQVLSGAINLTSAIQVRATAAYQDSTVARILELVENSNDQKSHSEKFISRFAKWYTPLVVLGAALITLCFTLFSNLGLRASAYRGLVFLVVSCPCALVVSVPLTFFCGIGAASRHGILIKGSTHLETLAQADTLVLDKTGTLTEGIFEVDAIHANEDLVESPVLLEIAALGESRSNHPVAQSITRAFQGELLPSRLGEVEEIPGQGLRAVIDHQTYYLGNDTLMKRIGVPIAQAEGSGTIVHIARKEESSQNLYLGSIVVRDQLKEDSASALQEARASGISRIVMLTGDNEEVAADVAAKVGITEYFSSLLPQDKVTRLQETRSNGSKVVFVGDGINDAPVLTQADVGIAMGKLGSDIAIEASDVVLMDDHLSRLPEAISLARRTMRIVKENIVISITVKVAILLLGALGIAGMRLSIFGDVGVLILAVVNALRAAHLPVQHSIQ